MATTQQKIDLRTARTAAAEAGLDCQIEASGDDYTITLDTGEIETVTGLPGALRVISAYTSAAIMSTKVIVHGQLVDFDAAVNLMDDDLREHLHSTVADYDDGDPQWYQHFINCYEVAHAEKFGEDFRVE
jgi:small nuclear ribonucleoprotein (snRNP)-like protein